MGLYRLSLSGHGPQAGLGVRHPLLRGIYTPFSHLNNARNGRSINPNLDGAFHHLYVLIMRRTDVSRPTSSGAAVLLPPSQSTEK